LEIVAKNDINYLHKDTGAYLEVFTPILELTRQQFAIGWPPHEFPVQEDLLEAKKVLTESEYHGLIMGLKLFTLYEMKAGEKYWGQRVMNMFNPSCIKGMASEFSRTELVVHSAFYNKINEALQLDSVEFYNEYLNDPILKARIEFIDEYIKSPDNVLSLAVFSMVEGAILYSQFAFMKHFRANGKNLMKNLVSGINASVKDENLHSIGGATLVKLELQYLGLSIEHWKDQIYLAAEKIYEHEEKIIDMMFSKGSMSGITSGQLKKFVKSRIDLCLENLELPKLYKVKPSENKIADWFYDGINSLKVHDFFNVSGGDYTNKWTEQHFLNPMKEEYLELLRRYL
jgi:ribonucleoside-diphosphate reductase beta chain